jgi:hypothetical protein
MNYVAKDERDVRSLEQMAEKLIRVCDGMRARNEQKAEGLKETGVLQGLKRFLFDTTLGTCDQMRVQLEIDYTARRVEIPVGKGVLLDGMVILPKFDSVNDEEPERVKIGRLASLDRRFEKADPGSSMITDNSYSLQRSFNHEETIEYQVGPVVIICQPNGAVYELSCYDNKVIEFYVQNGVTVVLWNYRGYGRSQGKPSMTVSDFFKAEYCARRQSRLEFH